MIHVLGEEGTREYEAAIELRDLILRVWPFVEQDDAHDVRIVAGAKCHGQDTRDIDILLIGQFAPGVAFSPFLPFQGWDGAMHTPKAIRVQSICCVLEVKDHSESAVRFVGTNVEVAYNNHWHSASEQNEKQLYAVKNYLEFHGIQAPWITPLIWLRNVPSTDLPPRPHPILGTPVTWELILNVITQVRRPRYVDGEWVLDAAGKEPLALAQMVQLFTKTIEPTRLDRMRVERITSRVADVKALRAVLGTKLLLVRGHGGTGKTMRLLQLAHQLSEDEGARVLVLTYNRALVADIRRLLTIVGINDDIAGGTIHIQTVHSFLYAVMRGLGVFDDQELDFLVEYDRLKDESLELLDEQVITRDDLERLIQSDTKAFRWDYVFVDEGQDWPRNERDLLLRIYPTQDIAVADGVTQLVRSTVPANWPSALPKSQRQVVSLSTTLRMKAGLARFTTAVARHLDLLHLTWEPNPEIPGGQVLIIDGPYLGSRSIHDQLVTGTKSDSNEPIDMLFCVPPALVARAQGRAGSRSVAATVFEQWGYRTWDGAAQDVRDSYPEAVDQLRIVQYESCRGLEGWTVVNLSFDRFYESKLQAEEVAETQGITSVNQTGRQDSQPYASQWAMIPLTRAMDTLVIQIDKERSRIRSTLEAATRECKDNVQWIRTR